MFLFKGVMIKNVFLLHQPSFCYIRIYYFSNEIIHIYIIITSLKKFCCGRIFFYSGTLLCNDLMIMHS